MLDHATTHPRVRECGTQVVKKILLGYTRLLSNITCHTGSRTARERFKESPNITRAEVIVSESLIETE